MALKRKMSQSQRLEVTLAKVEERVESLQEDIKELRTEVIELRATADRWKGGFWVMMGVGGVLGVLINFGIGWFK